MYKDNISRLQTKQDGLIDVMLEQKDKGVVYKPAKVLAKKKKPAKVTFQRKKKNQQRFYWERMPTK